MGNAEQGRDRPARLHLLFPGDARSVRSALKTAMAAFRAMELRPDREGIVEIVLAEVLNNVVEHAYAGQGGGMVELEVARLATALRFRIRDDGRPMPGGTAPHGAAQDLAVAAEDLPEGGFGWFLIRGLTEDLDYRRIGSRNELTFRITLGAGGPDRR